MKGPTLAVVAAAPLEAKEGHVQQNPHTDHLLLQQQQQEQQQQQQHEQATEHEEGEAQVEKRHQDEQQQQQQQQQFDSCRGSKTIFSLKKPTLLPKSLHYRPQTQVRPLLLLLLLICCC